MNQSPPFRFVMLCAALMLALTSVVSAGRMVQTTPANPQIAAFIAMGGTVDDLCGDGMPAHSGQCPFCHVTADVHPTRPTGQVWDLVPNSTVKALAALTFGNQRDPFAWSARGPPRAA